MHEKYTYMKNSKLLKTLLIPSLGISAIGMVATISTSCAEQINVSKILLNKRNLELSVNWSGKLIATVFPTNATNKSVKWFSEDESVATVDENGNVTAISAGETIISATSVENENIYDYCEVSCNFIHTESVTLNHDQPFNMFADTNILLVASVLPENASNKSLIWSSSDESVATVDENGNVTANSTGQTKITVTSVDNPAANDTCDISVTGYLQKSLIITANENSTLTLQNNGENNPDLQYSFDGVRWFAYINKINIDHGQTLFLKGNNQNGWSNSWDMYSTLSIAGDVSLSGSVMSLLDNGTGNTTTIPHNHCFFNLFKNSTGITNVSRNFLPATTLKDYCYSNMFDSCASLTTAPALPATTLADSCYCSMFKDCTSLLATPDLPATTLPSFCYQSMFDGCSSLTKAPNLPATTLKENCYCSMFEDCTSLLATPYLPATSLAEGCYSFMFEGCTSLTSAILPATSLAEGCYLYMFGNCSSLNSIKIYYTDAFNSNYFSSWTHNVASTGTFYYNGQYNASAFGLAGWITQPFLLD